MASFSLHRTRLGTPSIRVAQEESIVSRAYKETLGHSVRPFAVKPLHGGGATKRNFQSHGCRRRTHPQNVVPEQSGPSLSEDVNGRENLEARDSFAGSTVCKISKWQAWKKRGLLATKRELCNVNTVEAQQIWDGSALRSLATAHCDQRTLERRCTKAAAHAVYLEPAAAGANREGGLQPGTFCTEETLVLLRKAQRIHPKFFAGVTGLLLISYLTGSAIVSPTVQLTILALGVAILGVPHGALDLVTAQGLMREQAWPWPQPWNLALFVAAYSACTALVVFLWCHFPGASLAGLLAASAWHFGTNDAQGLLPGQWHWVEVAARGLGPITLPFILHKQETSLLFSHLAPPFAASHVSHLCTLLALPTALAVAATSLYCYLGPRTDTHLGSPAREQLVPREELTSSKTLGQLTSGPGLTRESRLAAGLEMALLGLGCTLAPPLLGFFLAFCTLHSLRHTLAFFADESTPASLADLRYVGKAAGMVTGVTLLVALAVFAGLLKHPILASHVAAFEMASVQVIFVGLAALTAPHMVLLEFSRQRRRLRNGRI
ncbi:hypothetical protein KFL_000290030 [Klebsormidium nitens]|uniref:Beta-carotene 15,15'-dioxygenase n=1 Tax=Klebsormidium nitens TaxID=105231 RepID=A0A1Y1HL64_KLENI|nr:hypothetical protein KFL_000290030 [Klebsormidium nitens]|eukprot:GAQ79354.1 hypothetical protein KFL_000290030 [Klebsormidium nitens]